MNGYTAKVLIASILEYQVNSVYLMICIVSKNTECYQVDIAYQGVPNQVL